jgi:anthranilate/para-aminobenzoate synthase component II
VVDFEDSFTFNLVSEIYKLGYDVEVLHWKKLQSRKEFDTTPILFGPGPGHISEYSEVGIFIRSQMGKRPMFGICLGHQLLMSVLGFDLVQEHPLHGVALSLRVPDWLHVEGLDSIQKLQFYNSWWVLIDRSKTLGYKIWEVDKKLIGFEGEGCLSFQFHPESVGTSISKVIFKKIITFAEKFSVGDEDLAQKGNSELYRQVSL